MISIAGIAFFQLYINGIRADTDTLSTSWSLWNSRTFYFTYDITSLLSPGINTVGVLLGRGWRDTAEFPVRFDPMPCDADEYLLRAVVLDSRGAVLVASDPLWNGTSSGPIVSDHVYNGETYDSRLEQPGWNKPGFVFPASGGWGPVPVQGPECFNPQLSPVTIPGIGVDSVASPVSITRLSDVSQVVNFGDNLSGWTKITVTGPAGSNVTLRHAEVLQHPPYGPANGEIYNGNLRSALATDIYILKGDPAGETFEPHFTYHGFQFVEVLYYPGDLLPQNIQQIHFHTLNPVRSSFTSSSPVLNKIQYAVVKGQASNQMSVPTDCDQRDERLGWMGDAGLTSDSFAINFDYTAFLDNYLQLMADNQDGSGSLPDVVPFFRYGGRPADPSWSAALPQNLWVRYNIDGNTDPVTKHWQTLLAYFGNIQQQVASAGSLSKWPAPYGDWVPADAATKVPNSLCAAYNYIVNAQQTTALAAATGNTADHAKFAKLATDVMANYTAAFFDNTTGCWSTCGQAGYSFAYQAQLVPAASIPSLTSALVSDITVKYTNHPSSGIIGVKALFPTLSALGQNDVALALAEQTSYPSWGYMFYNTLEPANSSIWELWDGPTQGPGMNSRNHHMFSSLSAWLVTEVGGIKDPAPLKVCGAGAAGPVRLAPAQLQGVAAADTTISTPCGDVKLAYQRHGGSQCARQPEGRSVSSPLSPILPPLSLSCGSRGGVISSLSFASWGYPTGTCGAFTAHPTCHSPHSLSLVSSLCLNKTECAVPTHADAWPGADKLDCSPPPSSPPAAAANPRTLAVEFVCSLPPSLTVSASLPVGAVATVALPTLGLSGYTVLESGVDVAGVPVAGVRAVTHRNGHVDVEVGSGSYEFTLA